MTPNRPFVDRPPGSLAVVTDVATHAAEHWGLPTPRLLRMGMNALFTSRDVVLRVARPSAPADSALALADVLSAAGIRVPGPARPDALTIGEHAVTAWQRMVPVDAEIDWRAVGQMTASVHALDPGDVPDRYPLPPCESFPWWRLGELLTEVGQALDEPARAGIEAVVERNRGWSTAVEHRVVCHGDLHPDNVVMIAAGPVLLDWDLLCLGPPAWDHSMLLRITRWGWPARWYEEFAAGYGQSLAGDPLAEAIAELRLVAASLMRLKAGLADPAAMPEAQRRLAYWRDGPSAPVWTPT